MTSNVNTDTILKSILFLIFFSVFIYNLDRIFIEHKEIILLMLLMSCMQYAWPEVFYIIFFLNSIFLLRIFLYIFTGEMYFSIHPLVDVFFFKFSSILKNFKNKYINWWMYWKIHHTMNRKTYQKISEVTVLMKVLHFSILNNI